MQGNSKEADWRQAEKQGDKWCYCKHHSPLFTGCECVFQVKQSRHHAPKTRQVARQLSIKWLLCEEQAEEEEEEEEEEWKDKRIKWKRARLMRSQPAIRVWCVASIFVTVLPQPLNDGAKRDTTFHIQVEREKKKKEDNIISSDRVHLQVLESSELAILLYILFLTHLKPEQFRLSMFHFSPPLNSVVLQAVTWFLSATSFSGEWVEATGSFLSRMQSMYITQATHVSTDAWRNINRPWRDH